MRLTSLLKTHMISVPQQGSGVLCCLSVMSVCMHILETTHTNFVRYSVHVACGRCLVLLRLTALQYRTYVLLVGG